MDDMEWVNLFAYTAPPSDASFYPAYISLNKQNGTGAVRLSIRGERSATGAAEALPLTRVQQLQLINGLLRGLFGPPGEESAF